MKKTLLLVTIAALSISAAACSKKEETAPTTAEISSEAVTEATTEAETETEEEVEEDYVSGLITKIDGNTITVKNDSDETEKNYDISNAEVNKEFPLSEGDWVDITFPAGSTEDPVPVMIFDVMESVIGQNTDPSAEGKVVDASEGTLTLEVDGEQYTLETANAYVVGKNGIEVNKNATVTYLGALDDAPMALKVVMEDSYNTPESEINAFIGTVAQVNEDGTGIVLESADGDFFTFVSDSIDFTEYEEDQTLKITYTGTISAKEIPAVEVTAE